MISEEVREMDSIFRSRSDQAESALEKYDEKKIEKLQESFLVKHHGQVEEIEVDEEDDVEVKTASHIITKTLLDEGKTIKEIADERKLSVDTVIGHIEKLLEYKEDVKLEHAIPTGKEFDKIAKTFEKLDTRKLTPVFDELKGKVSYQDIRLVRAYLHL
jgi:ATP-dependent DNA helicase RecQ